jgi:hypothetical protein
MIYCKQITTQRSQRIEQNMRRTVTTPSSSSTTTTSSSTTNIVYEQDQDKERDVRDVLQFSQGIIIEEDNEAIGPR